MSSITKKQAKQILIVDDVADNLFLAQFILENQGYKVITAENGKAALAQIETTSIKPDLIILDLMMPEMNGYEIIDYLRNHQSLSSIPIILMTANSNVSRQEAKNAGANGIVYKPFNLEQFIRKVKLVS